MPDWERLEGPNQWPSAMPELREVTQEWDAEMTRVGLTLLRAWAVALGQPADIFDAAFAADPPPCSRSSAIPAARTLTGRASDRTRMPAC